MDFIKIGSFLLIITLTAFISLVSGTLQPKAPNFQYFERPRYRFPYYDNSGKGKLLYGFGGDQLYEYTKYSPLEGVH